MRKYACARHLVAHRRVLVLSSRVQNVEQARLIIDRDLLAVVGVDAARHEIEAQLVRLRRRRLGAAGADGAAIVGNVVQRVHNGCPSGCVF